MYWVAFVLSFVLAGFFVEGEHYGRSRKGFVSRIAILGLVIFFFSTSLIAWGVS